ncbi:MAG TPA: alpha-1,2-fucosyltransferase [Cyclobacteriaceae bacterium]|nr:alpha-1,2-fucosyltransferase [Cyclobacteriaceae bacterium]
MIIVRLRGGLGNQLFQYAAGKALAEHHGTALRLDLYTYTKHPYRKFELNKFRIDATEATRAEVHRFTGSNPLVRYLNKRENYLHCPSVFSQPHYHFFEDFLSLPSDLYLNGYWQSEKYFANITALIHQQYQPATPLDAVNADLSARMSQEQSVAVHVRRGDYAASQDYQGFFGLLGKEYYDQAIAVIREKVSNPKFYFFSDDPIWCEANFTGLSAEFVKHNTGEQSYKDMLLMSACRHAIIANSTFSWWGAWLHEASDRVVIAPKQWFRTNYSTRKEPSYPSRVYNTKDQIPPTWIRL